MPETADLFDPIPQESLSARAMAATIDRPPIPRREQDVVPNSVLAHEQEMERLMPRAAAVVKCVHDHVMGTDRQVMEWMGFTDMNSVRPRITEMIDAGLLKVICNTVDPVTKKRVRLVGPV